MKREISATNIEIRKITSIEEIPVITELIASALRNDFPTYKKETVESYCRLYNDKKFTKFFGDTDYMFFGAYSNAHLIGVVIIKKEDGGVAWVEWLVVGSLYRGKGVGTRLLQTVEHWALENKFHCLCLYTETPSNLDFYRKKSFTFVGTVKKSWFGEDEHLFSKLLRDKPFEEVFKR